MYDFMFLFVLQALNQSLFSLHVAMTLLESVPYAADDCNLIFPFSHQSSAEFHRSSSAARLASRTPSQPSASMHDMCVGQEKEKEVRLDWKHAQVYTRSQNMDERMRL